jgi:hexosaminidase
MTDTAPTPQLIPAPDRLELTSQSVGLTTVSTLAADDRLAAPAERLREALGLPLPVTGSDPDVSLQLDEALPPEGYRLVVDGSSTPSVSISGGDPAGVFYGIQTLRQLMDPGRLAGADQPVDLPGVRIEDEPAFGWRGLMIDVGRHFMPIEELHTVLDWMALHKLNSLHLHLTEDQGWRFEVKSWPRLTEIGSHRTESVVGHARHSSTYDGVPHGGFYTQEELRSLVEYAAGRFIRIVPEIDLPGHTQAARAAYPELGYDGAEHQVMTTWGISEHIMRVDEKGVAFAKDVIGELIDVFPSPFIHIGGDEVPKKEWQASEIARRQVSELGLSDMDALQSWFTRQLAEFVESRGRRLVGWDEILEGGDLPPGVVVMSWRGMEPGLQAARLGLDVVMASTSHTYYDYSQGDPATEPLSIGGSLTLETVWEFEPTPAELNAEEARHILGVQAQLWREYMPDLQTLERMAFPRLAALAEIAWQHGDRSDFAEFRGRLAHHLTRLDALGVNYRPLDAAGSA